MGSTTVLTTECRITIIQLQPLIIGQLQLQVIQDGQVQKLVGLPPLHLNSLDIFLGLEEPISEISSLAKPFLLESQTNENKNVSHRPFKLSLV